MSNSAPTMAVTRPLKTTYFKRTTLAACIMAASSGAWAQSDASEQIEEIVVQGVRGALQNAQEMKRDANTVVDAISASDINALPDKSVLEALQRVPGVAIERFAAADDPDHFTIEGSGLTLRGMPQTRSEFNGRDSFSANSGRGLSFQDVPPELMGSVEVYKNHTADMIEGGISGTINLNTRKPFDSDDRQIAFAGGLNYTDMADKTSPDLSGLYSDRWDTSAGEFGLLLSLSSSTLFAENNSIQNGINRLTDVAGVGERWVPINVAVRTSASERNRVGGSMVGQWANNEETMLATVEYVHSKSTQAWDEHGVQSDDTVSTPSADSVYNDFNFVSGTLTGGNEYNTLGRYSDKESSVDDFSFNLQLTPNEKWTIELDAQYVTAKTDHTDLSIFGNLPADAKVDFGGSAPKIEFIAPGGADSAAYFSDPANYFYRAAMDHVEESDGDEKAIALDVEYHIDAGWFKSVKGGVRASERHQTTRWSTYNWGVLSESWDNGKQRFDGVHEGTDWSAETTYDAPEYDTLGFGDFYRGGAIGVAGGTLLAPNLDLVKNYGTFTSELSSIFGFNHLGTRAGVVENYYLPIEINDTDESNRAAYAMLNFNSPNEALSGNFGVRYVSVSNKTVGGSVFNQVSSTLPLPPEDLAFANGASYPSTVESTSSHWLPSLNLKYDINDDWLVRAGVSKAVSYPDLGNLRNFMSINPIVQGVDTDDDDVDDEAYVEEYRATAGNPYLEPMTSINYDATIEWYFADVGAVTAGVFYKDMANFFVSGAFPRQMTNNGITNTVEVEGPINAGDATIKGAEFAYQQFFDDLPGAWSGLGFQANYTYVADSGVPNGALNPAKGDEPTQDVAFDGLPLQGMSEHTYNLVGIYEYSDVAARLAWNWRSSYLLTVRDVITGLPIYNSAGGQLDGSLFYSINDNFKIGMEATNLLNQVTKTEMQVDEEGNRLDRSWFINDRRFAVVLRASF